MCVCVCVCVRVHKNRRAVKLLEQNVNVILPLHLDVRVSGVAGPPLPAAALLLAVGEELRVAEDSTSLAAVHQRQRWLLLKTFLVAL